MGVEEISLDTGTALTGVPEGVLALGVLVVGVSFDFFGVGVPDSLHK